VRAQRRHLEELGDVDDERRHGHESAGDRVDRLDAIAFLDQRSAGARQQALAQQAGLLQGPRDG